MMIKAINLGRICKGLLILSILYVSGGLINIFGGESVPIVPVLYVACFVVGLFALTVCNPKSFRILSLLSLGPTIPVFGTENWNFSFPGLISFQIRFLEFFGNSKFFIGIESVPSLLFLFLVIFANRFVVISAETHQKESPPISKGDHQIKTTILCTIIATLISVPLTRVLESSFSSIQNPGMFSEEQFHLQKISKDAPPFAYKVEFVGREEERRYGFLGLAKIPPIWSYRIFLANLTKTKIGRVIITVKLNEGDGHLVVAPLADNIEYCDKAPLEPKKWYPLDKHKRELTFVLNDLPSASGKAVFIGIVSAEHPSVEGFEILAECTEGRFCQITPLQWDAIGWK